MIISASRRTDLPAFYSDWFFNRLREGYVLVRNPVNPRRVSRISLKSDAVDCIVFWTKNPESMLPKLGLLKDYPYYFQFTLNPYDAILEPGVPRKAQVIETFKRLSEVIGPDRVIWRYDPILLNGRIDSAYHEKYYELLARKLHPYTSRCVISFLDYYRKIDKVYKAHEMMEIADAEKRRIAGKIAEAARQYGLPVETCAEEIDLSDMGIGHARCVDPVLIGSFTGTDIKYRKDRNQREACGCMASTDIGAYDTCPHGCVYCYANNSSGTVKRAGAKYDPHSPLLCDELMERDQITERRG